MLAFIYFVYQMMSLMSFIVQYKHDTRAVVILMQERNSHQDMLTLSISPTG
jgi:hypothetical protein